MYGYAVLHCQNLYVPFLASLDDGALPVATLDCVAAVGNLCRQLRDNLLPVREKVPALPGALSCRAPENLVE